MRAEIASSGKRGLAKKLFAGEAISEYYAVLEFINILKKWERRLLRPESADPQRNFLRAKQSPNLMPYLNFIIILQQWERRLLRPKSADSQKSYEERRLLRPESADSQKSYKERRLLRPESADSQKSYEERGLLRFIKFIVSKNFSQTKEFTITKKKLFLLYCNGI